MSRQRVHALGAVVVLVAAVVPTTAARAATISCGDTITANVALTRNLMCSGDGLIVGRYASDMTIDLNGFKLTGSGSGAGIGGWGPAGSKLTIKNGTISGFATGIGASMTTHLVNLNVLSNEFGVGAYTHVEIRDSTFRSNGVGVNDAFLRSVVDSTFDSNGIGLKIPPMPPHVFISGSTFRNNEKGIRAFDCEMTVTSSRFTGNGTGIWARLCGARIRGNQFVGGTTAVYLWQQEWGLEVAGNTFTKTAGVALEVDGISGAIDRSKSITDNVFKDNGASGLAIRLSWYDASELSVEVQGNTFKGNGFNAGAAVDPSGNPLTAGVWADTGSFIGNQAISNAGHGIEGYNVIDGGGNTAKSNGAEPQCIGVVCTP